MVALVVEAFALILIKFGPVLIVLFEVFHQVISFDVVLRIFALIVVVVIDFVVL